LFTVNKNIQLHFIGIGGIGMSGLAQCLLSMGVSVSGSDITESPNTRRLVELGAKISIGHKAENIEGPTTVVYSSAIDPENPEMVQAHRLNIPLMKRAEMLAELMRLKKGIAIAGTHGKTTTTSFLATILSEAELDPTYIIGGIVQNLKGHAKIGQGEFLVAEADESDGSFLLLSPVMSVITNIDNDHLNQYGSEGNLIKAFWEFANKVPFYGVCALCINDPHLREMVTKMKKPYVTFGMDMPKAQFEARNLKFTLSTSQFDLYHKGKFATEIIINLPGRHYVLNSLGAIALSHQMGIPFPTIAKSITKFAGVGRRFELLYKKDNVEIIDDYGHHPTEVHATLSTLCEIKNSRTIRVIFEPHRFTRTRDCWDQFVHCFKGADEVLLLPIYSASEKPIDGIDSSLLCLEINRHYPGLARHLGEGEKLENFIPQKFPKELTILALGAGSIGKKVREIIKKWN
jgi:UDP-N-acetylmuramate--alanine ligase